MDDPETINLQVSYDRVADEYARRIFDELKDKPLDRELLDRFAVRLQGCGPVCDLGCGPGQVARYLHERGVEVIGVDLSPAMVECARRLNPGIRFHHGTILALDVADGAWGGIVAFYSIIHIPRPEVTRALRELHRVLRPEGLLLLAFHIGEATIHKDEWWGQKVSVDFVFFQPGEMAAYLRTAGWVVEELIEREPYPDVEYPSRRAYILAKKPAEGPKGYQQTDT
jgi:SAM-dependent methyltransferase